MGKPAIKIGILASGQGSTGAFIHQNILDGNLQDMEIALLICNNSKAGALEYCRTHKISHLHISGKTHPQNEAKAIADAFTSAPVDIVLSLGYLKKIDALVYGKFPTYNIHPSYLPSNQKRGPDTYVGGEGLFGKPLFTEIINSGAQYTGSTLHEVNKNYDEGEIVLQSKPVDIPQNLSTLTEKISYVENSVKQTEKTMLLDFLKTLPNSLNHWHHKNKSKNIYHQTTEQRYGYSV